MTARCDCGAAAVPAVVQLPARLGGTVCEVRVLGDCPQRTVELRELDDNPGLPLSVAFAAVRSRIRAQLSCPHEPAWVELWPAAATTSALMDQPLVPARHLLRRTPTGWAREPLPHDAFARLVARRP